MKCKNIVLPLLFAFRFHDSALSFVSGIFVAASVNIFTSQIPDSVLKIGFSFGIVGFNFLVMAILLMRWSIIIKPAQLLFEKNKGFRKKNNISDQQGWYDSLTANKLIGQLTIIIFALAFLLLITIILLVMGNGSMVCSDNATIGNTQQ